jgi:hypothetical protein
MSAHATIFANSNLSTPSERQLNDSFRVLLMVLGFDFPTLRFSDFAITFTPVSNRS